MAKESNWPTHPGMALPRPTAADRQRRSLSPPGEHLPDFPCYAGPAIQMSLSQRKVLELIGECEWCGMTDHHLIEGECPRCRETVNAVKAVDDEVPMGYEAADLNAIVFGK